jgi:hypothetical protein
LLKHVCKKPRKVTNFKSWREISTRNKNIKRIFFHRPLNRKIDSDSQTS